MSSNTIGAQPSGEEFVFFAADVPNDRDLADLSIFRNENTPSMTGDHSYNCSFMIN